MNKLFLFDIDNTLVKNSTLHRDAFLFSLKKIFGIDADFTGVTFAGMTDSSIIHEILAAHDYDITSNIEKVDQCMENMAQYYKENISLETSTIVEGANSILKELKQNNILGLVTGNVQEIGFAKLERLDLNHHFETGGFGDDHPVRFRLVEKALERFQKLYGRDFKNDAVIIGDTPKDVEAAYLAGVPAVAIAQGHYSVDELKKAGAEWVISSYKDFPKL